MQQCGAEMKAKEEQMKEEFDQRFRKHEEEMRREEQAVELNVRIQIKVNLSAYQGF